MKNRFKILLVLGWIGGVMPAFAAFPGALESFPKLENAESWSVFDFADDTVYFPAWADEGNPSIYLSHAGDAALWFFSDETGSPAWLGDYDFGDIQSIEVDVYIDSLEDFEQIDCTVFTNGPAGRRYYYSELFIAADFSAGGWWTLTFDLEGTWYYFDEEWHSVALNLENFQEVEEIGFRFLPRVGTTAELLAAIDEVKLVPLVRTPDLEVSATTEEFLIEFTPAKATACSLEKLAPGPSPVWKKVAGQTDITGPGPHVFSVPLVTGRGIFRVGAEARYTQVVFD